MGDVVKLTQRELDEFDAEIEASFQRAVAKTKVNGQRRREQRMVGAPLAFIAEVCRLTTRRASLIVALLIYRRTCVCHSQTVTLPGAELAELGIDRKLKRKALVQLVAAGIIQVERTTDGHSATVTLIWKTK
jgi:hypothetical protein